MIADIYPTNRTYNTKIKVYKGKRVYPITRTTKFPEIPHYY